MVTDYRSPTFFDRSPIPNLNRFYRSLENRGCDDKSPVWSQVILKSQTIGLPISPDLNGKPCV